MALPSRWMPRVRPSTTTTILGSAVLAACEGRQSALAPGGDGAREILDAAWILFVGGTAIFAGVMALALYAVAVPPERFRGGRGWVVGGGLLFPIAALTLLQLYEFGLTRRLVAAPEPALVIEVTGAIWWWDVRYRIPGQEPVRSANEIVLPAGRPVEIRLDSADVIHSFWIPSLAGKLDMIPGRVNRLSLTPETSGVYRGQCAEYCGAQHALMAFAVVVEPPDRFDAWLAGQRRPAAEPAEPLLERGRDAFFAFGCHSCHAVRGTPADGRLGPDLSKVGGRRSLGAGSLPNGVGPLAGWIVGVQHLKPESRMPSFDVMDADTLHALAAWLESLT